MTGDPIPIMIAGVSLGTALRIAVWTASIAARRSAGRLARYWSGVVGFITAKAFPGASHRIFGDALAAIAGSSPGGCNAGKSSRVEYMKDRLVLTGFSTNGCACTTPSFPLPNQ